MVEGYYSDGPPDFNGLPEYLEGFKWRDARVEDLSFIGDKAEGRT
jgi:hypothetical protein